MLVEARWRGTSSARDRDGAIDIAGAVDAVLGASVLDPREVAAAAEARAPVCGGQGSWRLIRRK